MTVIQTLSASLTLNILSFVSYCFAEKSPEGKAPEIVEPLKFVQVLEGSPAELKCQISGQPKPTVEWLRGNEKVKESERIQFVSNNETFSLNFKETELDDEGDYKCVAQNEFGSVSCWAEFLVNKPAAKPEFREKMKHVTVQVGQQARFDVLITGVPRPQVDWMKDGKILEEPAERFTFLDDEDEEDEGRSSLTIEDVKLEDAGKYGCLAFNEEGEVFCEANLLVQETLIAPAFVDEAESAPILAEEGGEINLSAELRKSQPELKVEWLKDDKTIKEDQRLNRFVIEDTHMLKITGVVPEDSGLYKLKASGKAGSVEREFDVQISGIVSSCSVHSLAPNYNH